MKTLNHFAETRLERVIEIMAIRDALDSFNIKASLSDDTFNANIRFQRQYIDSHLSALVGSIPGELNKDRMSKTFIKSNGEKVEIEIVEMKVIQPEAKSPEITQQDLNDYDFKSLEDYFEYVVDSITNGQRTQAKTLLKALSKDQKLRASNYFLEGYRQNDLKQYFEAMEYTIESI